MTFWLTVTAVAFVLLMFAGVAVIALCEAADERKTKQATLTHLNRLRREAEAMNYGKGKPRKLTRFREAMTGKWVLNCGHLPQWWSWERLCCEKQQHDIGGEG